MGRVVTRMKLVNSGSVRLARDGLLATGIVVLVISGTDISEHGNESFVEVENDLRASPFAGRPR